jgi:hypothetical protein
MTETTPATTSAERIRNGVLSVPGVADMHAGTFGEIATHLPGRRVGGVRIDRSGVRVHVIVYLGTDIAAVARQVRAAAAIAAPGAGPYTVVVEDVVPQAAAVDDRTLEANPLNVSSDMSRETRKS